jgi:hypothetical protein
MEKERPMMKSPPKARVSQTLRLSSETLRRLTPAELGQVQGGTDTILPIQKPGH